MVLKANAEERDDPKVVRSELEDIGRQVIQVLGPNRGNFIEENMTELERKIEGLCASNKDLFALLDKIDFESIKLC